MIVYHGSSLIVNEPDVLHSFRSLDFGKGFYVTTNKKQAERWAIRKALVTGKGKPIINIYQMQEDYSDLAVKAFDDNLAEWIDFVCSCRDGDEDYRKYDLIRGRVANDRVYRVVNMYHLGYWDRDRAIKEMKVYPEYDQIAFISQKAIARLLSFAGGEEV